MTPKNADTDPTTMNETLLDETRSKLQEMLAQTCSGMLTGEIDGKTGGRSIHEIGWLLREITRTKKQTFRERQRELRERLKAAARSRR